MNRTERQPNRPANRRRAREWSRPLDEEAVSILARAARQHTATLAEESDADSDGWGWAA